MAEGDGQDPPTPIGVVLMENLTKALLKNTEAQIAATASHSALVEEIKLLRGDLEGIGGFSEELLGHLTTYLRILDHVATSSLERPPRWKDVQEVLREIKDEIQQAEAEAENEEEDEQGDGPPARGSTELFPKRKTS